VFIPTTLAKLENAEQINDLFDGSPLEDKLWQTLKQHRILAERQWKILVARQRYYLDFAVFCRKGKLAIETDGYTYHYDDRNPACRVYFRAVAAQSHPRIRPRACGESARAFEYS
jgi:very-short-patch-repair endonuclease